MSAHKCLFPFRYAENYIFDVLVLLNHIYVFFFCVAKRKLAFVGGHMPLYVAMYIYFTKTK